MHMAVGRSSEARNGVVYVAPAIGPDVNEIARLLEGSGLLRALVSRLMFPESVRQLLASCGISMMSRRASRPVDKSLVRTDLLADLIPLLLKATGRNHCEAMDRAFERVDSLASREVDHTVAAVLGREDGCLHSFRAGRRFGVTTIYQLPTAFYKFVKAAMEKEIALFPGVCLDAEETGHYAAERCERKDEELLHADYVLCPSEFVRQSVAMQTTASTRAHSIPFGIDAEYWKCSHHPKEPLFLYVGNISMRKGIHRVLLIWKQLKAYKTHRLRLVGEMRLSTTFLKGFAGMYDWVAPLPRAELARHYCAANAFVFNSLADGFGHVFAEAMACGTPVICSRNSGAPDLITDGVEGRLFNYGADEQLASILEWALGHPRELALMGASARQKALRSGWDKFGQSFLPWISSVTSAAA
jgi:glycosyltransferase involved in cell wall biosynthesis